MQVTPPFYPSVLDGIERTPAGIRCHSGGFSKLINYPIMVHVSEVARNKLADIRTNDAKICITATQSNGQKAGILDITPGFLSKVLMRKGTPTSIVCLKLYDPKKDSWLNSLADDRSFSSMTAQKTSDYVVHHFSANFAIEGREFTFTEKFVPYNGVECFDLDIDLDEASQWKLTLTQIDPNSYYTTGSPAHPPIEYEQQFQTYQRDFDTYTLKNAFQDALEDELRLLGLEFKYNPRARAMVTSELPTLGCAESSTPTGL